MDIFENLENLNVSEECFDEIMGIVEEIINELYATTIGSAHNERVKNYRNAVYKAKANPSNFNIETLKHASNKLRNNKELSYKAFKRSGNDKDADDVNPQKQYNIAQNSLNKYKTAQNTEKLATEKYNNALNMDRAAARGRGVSASVYDKGKRHEFKDAAEQAQVNTRQARKDYHDTLDRTNMIPQNDDYLRNHLEYQRTHDDKGNRK